MSQSPSNRPRSSSLLGRGLTTVVIVVLAILASRSSSHSTPSTTQDSVSLTHAEQEAVAAGLIARVEKLPGGLPRVRSEWCQDNV